MDKLKTKVQNADWWEIGYLIIYGFILIWEFFQTTMFEIAWPPKMGYVFAIISCCYVVAKFIGKRSYTKKDIILSILILVAFVIPAFGADYAFLFWIGFLIVGAKDVSTTKLLKVYLFISITMIVVTFAASQCGIIEDLQYILYEGEQLIVRHSYGIIYPTDYAAHVFYVVLALTVFLEDKLNLIVRSWMIILVAMIIYTCANAKTSTLCLLGFMVMCLMERVLRKHMYKFSKILAYIPLTCALVFLLLAYNYDASVNWKLVINKLLNGRLELSKIAFDNYDIKLFGQYIPEVGSGASLEEKWDYFFIDDAYVRILMEYGIVLFIVTLVMMVVLARRFREKGQFLLVFALAIVSVHSIMEHHLLEVAYNPFLFMLFADIPKSKIIGGQNV